MRGSQQWAVQSPDDVVTCMEATAAGVFAWLCVLVGARDAERLMPLVYVGLAGEDSVVEDDLVAAAFRLAATRPDPDLSIIDRALIELRSVRGRADADVGAIVGIDVVEVPAAAEAAERNARRVRPDTPFADIGREREVWLDDDTRERCRAAIRPAAPTDGDPTDQPQRIASRRRISGVVVLVAAVLGGVVWARSDHDPVAPDPSGPTVLGQAPGYVLTDLVEGYHAVSVGELSVADAGRPLGQLQIWASPAATRTAGSWFSVLTARCAPIDAAVAAGARRIRVNGRAGVIIDEADGVRVLRVQTGTNELTSQTLEVRAHELADARMERIASSVLLASGVKDPTELPSPACDASRPAVVNEFDSTFDGLHSAMDLVVTVPWYAGSADSPDHDGQPTRTVRYARDDAGNDDIVVTTRSPNPARDVLARYLRMSSTDRDSPASSDRTEQIGTQRVTISADVAADGRSRNIVEWSAGGATVDIASTLALSRLLPLVAGVRLATTHDWATLRASVADAAATSSTSPTVDDVLHFIGSATTESGATWFAYVEPDAGTLRLQLEGTAVDVRLPLVIDPDHPVHEFASADATLLVVALAERHRGAQVIATVDGTGPAPTLATSVTGDDTYALIAFDAIGPYTVQLMDYDGQLRTLTT